MGLDTDALNREFAGFFAYLFLSLCFKLEAAISLMVRCETSFLRLIVSSGMVVSYLTIPACIFAVMGYVFLSLHDRIIDHVRGA